MVTVTIFRVEKMVTVTIFLGPRFRGVLYSGPTLPFCSTFALSPVWKFG
jgi:hypothetical protein